jgi:hypothetical protein
VSAHKHPGHHGLGTRGDIELHTGLFPECDNTQVTHLLGNAIGTWDDPKTGNRPRNVSPDESTLPDDEEQADRLAEAIALIDEEVAFVGLVEHWNDSLRLFCRKHSCTDPEQSPNGRPERQSSRKDDDQQQQQHPHSKNDSTAMAAIRQSNAADMQLHKAAAARFCRDLLFCEQDPEFVATLLDSSLQLCQNLDSSSSTPSQRMDACAM